MIESLANADEKGKIICIKEIFADYYVVDPEIFSLKIPSLMGKTNIYADITDDGEEFKQVQRMFLKTAEDALFSVCMSLRRVPNITYSLECKIGRKIAERLNGRLEREYNQNHKDFLQESMDLLIYDRREDPVTPLIYNWSYQSMVNEFVGVDNNSVKVSGGSGKPEVFARQTDDAFLDRNWLKNFGEFSMDLSRELEKLYKEKHMSTKVSSLEDMQAALEKMPDLSKEATRIKKHSELIKLISDGIQNGDIYSVSQLQQDIITENNKVAHFKEVLNLLAKRQISNLDKLKLSMIFVLKYHDDAERISGLQRALQTQNLPGVIFD